MRSFIHSVGSFVVTVSMMAVSLVILHETHKYSKTVIPHSSQISALAIVCPVLSILSYLSPITAAVDMVKRTDESHFPIIVIMAQASQNIACGAYGLKRGDDPCFLSSCIGLVFQLIWLTMY